MKDKQFILDMISYKNLVTVFVSSMIIAFTYALCFTTLYTPTVSLSIFTVVTISTIIMCLKRVGLKLNNRAYYLLIPIALLVIANLLFVSNAYINLFLVFGLIVVFTVQLINPNVEKYFTLELLNQVLKSTFYKKRGKSALGVIFKRKSAKGSEVVKVIVGIAIALPLMLIILGLLMSADAIFVVFIIDALSIDFSLFGEIITFIISLLISFYILLNYILAAKEEYNGHFKIAFDKTIFTTFLFCINFIFLLFCISQLSYIIFGDGLFKLPSYMTYAEYARSGFFQLLFVSVINFIVILIFINFMKNLNEVKIIKKLLICLVIFTLVLVVSSMYRIAMYTDHFGFTELRLQVILFLLFNFILLVITLIKLFKYNISVGKYVTVIVIAGIVANAYVGNYFVAAILNVELYSNGKIESIDTTGYDKNDDYYAYLRYAVNNDLVDVSKSNVCYEEDNNWRSETIISLFGPKCK